MPYGCASAKQDAWERAKADPMVGVVDLEDAIALWFTSMGVRSFDHLIEAVRSSAMSWKSVGKATHFSLWSLPLVFCTRVWFVGSGRMEP